MAAKKNIKHCNTSIPELSKAMHGLNASSAASPHDVRPHRQRSRKDAKRAAINNGW